MYTLVINERNFDVRPLSNGAKELVAVDGREISEDEWEAYCKYIQSNRLER